MTAMMWIPTGLVTDHWNTLVSQKDGTPMKGDRFLLIAIPLAAAIVTGIWEPDNFSVMLDATAITTALLFGLLVHVFSLGLSASGNEYLRGTWVVRLIDELRINTAYAILIGILAVIFLGTAGAYADSRDLVVRPLGSVGVFFVVHLLMTLGMVIKRTNTAYVQMRKLTNNRSTSSTV